MYITGLPDRCKIHGGKITWNIPTVGLMKFHTKFSLEDRAIFVMYDMREHIWDVKCQNVMAIFYLILIQISSSGITPLYQVRPPLLM